ncbi:MAG: peptidoglycan-binding protein [Patescibacteria group bacterium]
MKKIKYIVATALFLAMFAGSTGIASAQTSSSTEALMAQVQSLLKQIKSLQDQMVVLNNQRMQLKTELQQTLQLTKSLRLGMTSDEVKLLQEMLATDSDIYPEGLTTGFFGPLTEKAVKKFQKKFGIEQAGEVGPKTRARINALLSEGLGSAGKLPPGWAKKVDSMKEIEDEDDDDDGDDDSDSGQAKITICHKGQTLRVSSSAFWGHHNHGDTMNACGTTAVSTPTTDTTAPVISNLASTTATTTAYVSWTTNENATSILWYSTVTPVSTSTATKLETSSLKTAHSYSIADLASTTTYYYLVKVVDVAGNIATSTEHSFLTIGN